MKNNLLVFVLGLVVILTGCTIKSNSSKSEIEKAKESSNSVVCTQTKDMNYYDVEALKQQEEGTYKEGLELMPNYVDDAEREAAYAERERKQSIKTGTITREMIFEFNKAGDKIEKMYYLITSAFDHEDVTDSMLKANRDYLNEYYKTDDNYKDYNVYVDGKKVVRELTVNMDSIPDKSKLNMTKQQIIYLYSMTKNKADGSSVSTVCKAN